MSVCSVDEYTVKNREECRRRIPITDLVCVGYRRRRRTAKNVKVQLACIEHATDVLRPGADDFFCCQRTYTRQK